MSRIRFGKSCQKEVGVVQSDIESTTSCQFLTNFAWGCTCFKIWVPQESLLSPLFFNIFIKDVSLINLESEICNFADDNTLYSCGHDLQEIVTNLEHDLCKLLEWFRNNGVVVNPRKFQLMFLGMKIN